jgi:tetratricopeptide (TPR) repeat protein
LRIAWLSILTLLLCAPAHAGDDDDDKPGAATGEKAVEARKRFAEGNELYAKGDYDKALEAFRAAIAADPSLPGPYRNLGLVYRALNKCEEALTHYEKYLQLKPEGRFTERVRREIDICRAKLGMQPAPAPVGRPPGQTGSYRTPEAQSFLHIAANLIGGEATDEASVRVDGLVRGSTPLTIPVTAGVHRIHLERPGFETADTQVDVKPGERLDIELTMNKLPDEPVPVAIDTTEPAKQRKGSYRKPAWAALGVAAGLGLLGAGFGIAESWVHREAINLDRPNTSRDEVNRLRDEGQGYAIAAYVGLAAGGAALIAAAVLFIVDPQRKETHDKQKFLPTAFAGPQGGGLGAAVRF